MYIEYIFLIDSITDIFNRYLLIRISLEQRQKRLNLLLTHPHIPPLLTTHLHQHTPQHLQIRHSFGISFLFTRFLLDFLFEILFSLIVLSYSPFEFLSCEGEFLQLLGGEVVGIFTEFLGVFEGETVFS